MNGRQTLRVIGVAARPSLRPVPPTHFRHCVSKTEACAPQSSPQEIKFRRNGIAVTWIVYLRKLVLHYRFTHIRSRCRSAPPDSRWMHGVLRVPDYFFFFFTAVTTCDFVGRVTVATALTASAFIFSDFGGGGGERESIDTPAAFAAAAAAATAAAA